MDIDLTDGVTEVSLGRMIAKSSDTSRQILSQYEQGLQRIVKVLEEQHDETERGTMLLLQMHVQQKQTQEIQGQIIEILAALNLRLESQAAMLGRLLRDLDQP
ncbi:MAG: hypothetical protein NDJ24_05695 [Alphaproteobacteria bacterium]|nr:hypothetical protein [Alphaproteobacteria bacterium]